MELHGEFKVQLIQSTSSRSLDQPSRALPGAAGLRWSKILSLGISDVLDSQWQLPGSSASCGTSPVGSTAGPAGLSPDCPAQARTPRVSLTLSPACPDGPLGTQGRVSAAGSHSATSSPAYSQQPQSPGAARRKAERQNPSSLSLRTVQGGASHASTPRQTSGPGGHNLNDRVQHRLRANTCGPSSSASSCGHPGSASSLSSSSSGRATRSSDVRPPAPASHCRVPATSHLPAPPPPQLHPHPKTNIPTSTFSLAAAMAHAAGGPTTLLPPPQATPSCAAASQPTQQPVLRPLPVRYALPSRLPSARRSGVLKLRSQQSKGQERASAGVGPELDQGQRGVGQGAGCKQEQPQQGAAAPARNCPGGSRAAAGVPRAAPRTATRVLRPRLLPSVASQPRPAAGAAAAGNGVMRYVGSNKDSVSSLSSGGGCSSGGSSGPGQEAPASPGAGAGEQRGSKPAVAVRGGPTARVGTPQSRARPLTRTSRTPPGCRRGRGRAHPPLAPNPHPLQPGQPQQLPGTPCSSKPATAIPALPPSTIPAKRSVAIPPLLLPQPPTHPAPGASGPQAEGPRTGRRVSLIPSPRPGCPPAPGRTGLPPSCIPSPRPEGVSHIPSPRPRGVPAAHQPLSTPGQPVGTGITAAALPGPTTASAEPCAAQQGAGAAAGCPLSTTASLALAGSEGEPVASLGPPPALATPHPPASPTASVAQPAPDPPTASAPPSSPALSSTSHAALTPAVVEEAAACAPTPCSAAAQPSDGRVVVGSPRLLSCGCSPASGVLDWAEQLEEAGVGAGASCCHLPLLQALSQEVKALRQRCKELHRENLRLRSNEFLDPALSDSVREQLEVLLADKAALVADNSRLQQENAGLQHLLDFTVHVQAQAPTPGSQASPATPSWVWASVGSGAATPTATGGGGSCRSSLPGQTVSDVCGPLQLDMGDTPRAAHSCAGSNPGLHHPGAQFLQRSLQALVFEAAEASPSSHALPPTPCLRPASQPRSLPPCGPVQLQPAVALVFSSPVRAQEGQDVAAGAAPLPAWPLQWEDAAGNEPTAGGRGEVVAGGGEVAAGEGVPAPANACPLHLDESPAAVEEWYAQNLGTPTRAAREEQQAAAQGAAGGSEQEACLPAWQPGLAMSLQAWQPNLAASLAGWQPNLAASLAGWQGLRFSADSPTEAGVLLGGVLDGAGDEVAGVEREGPAGETSGGLGEGGAGGAQQEGQEGGGTAEAEAEAGNHGRCAKGDAACHVQRLQAYTSGKGKAGEQGEEPRARGQCDVQADQHARVKSFSPAISYKACLVGGAASVSSSMTAEQPLESADAASSRGSFPPPSRRDTRSHTRSGVTHQASRTNTASRGASFGRDVAPSRHYDCTTIAQCHSPDDVRPGRDAA